MAASPIATFTERLSNALACSARILCIKKDLSETEKSFMVQDGKKVLHRQQPSDYAKLRLEVQRWRDILAVPYAQYKSKLVPL